MRTAQEIAEVIEGEAKKRNIPVNKLLKECGVSVTLVDVLKKGSMPSADKIHLVAIYLDTSTDYLLTGNEPLLIPTKNEKDIVFYEQIMQLCKEREVKITPLVKILGLGEGGIKRWREGSSPTGETLLKFADYFNVSTDYLLGREEKKQEVHLRLIEKEEGVLMEYNDLTEIQKDIMQRAYAFYKKKPGFPSFIELGLQGACLDLTNMPELYMHYNDLMNKGLIYNTLPDGMVMRYWLNESGVDFIEKHHEQFSRRMLERKSLSSREKENPLTAGNIFKDELIQEGEL